MNMSYLKIGCHLSSSNGYLAMGKEIVSINGNTFQFFTRNPRGGKAKEVNYQDIEEYNKFAKDNNIEFIVAHAPYTMNLCSLDESTRQFALRVFKEDLNTLEYVNNVYYNFHPGSHVGQGFEKGAEYIIDALNSSLKKGQKTIVLLETMAGKGSEIGRSFEEIKYIIDRVELKECLGVCLDTCHVYDGGYDIVNKLDEVLSEFDRVIGLSYLKAIHLNDTMNELDSHKDRHQKIGLGSLGLDGVTRIINHPKLKDLPFVLETPNEIDGYKNEIELFRSKRI